PLRPAGPDGRARDTGTSADRGRRPGVRRGGRGPDGDLLHLQLLPDQEPLRARGWRPCHQSRRRRGRARPDAPVPRFTGQEDVRARRNELAPRRGAGRHAARLPARRGGVDRTPPPRGRAVRGARARRGGGAARRGDGPRLPHVRRPLLAPRRDRCRSGPRRDRMRLLLRHPAPSAAGDELPRHPPRLLAGDREGGGREPRAPDVGRDRRGATGARGRSRLLGGRRPRLAMRSPVNRFRLWQVAVDAALIAAAWVLSWYVRFEGDTRPRYYDRYLDWDVVVLVVGIMLPVFVAF